MAELNEIMLSKTDLVKILSSLYTQFLLTSSTLYPWSCLVLLSLALLLFIDIQYYYITCFYDMMIKKKKQVTKIIL